MNKAFYFIKEGRDIICLLCPNSCVFSKENQIGRCLAYIRIDNSLFSENYGKIVSASLDPIEKKPLYHFYPAKKILSIGTYGCNMKCSFCQNNSISQNKIECDYTSSEAVIKKALELKELDNIGIAFTYNEPFTWYEYVYNTSLKAKENDLKTVCVSNGMINEKPLKDLIPFIDAFNIDLKSIKEDFYRKICKGHIETVKNTINIIFHEGKHIEITNLLIEGENDSIYEMEELAKFISSISKNIPLHISRYFPSYNMKNPKTSIYRLEKAYDIAKKYLNHVYIGNTIEENDTICPECGNIIIKRNPYNIKRYDKDGRCIKCGNKVLEDYR